MYEFASHGIDLVVYLLDRPDAVVGSVLQSIHSSEGDDLVSSTFLYNKGFSGTILGNWSDETYRKPTNIVKIMGTAGKIIADKHAYKIYLKEAKPEKGYEKGWNTRYLTDFAKSVRFYVRGNEFTRQLDYFIDCIENKHAENLASFAEGLKTDRVMEEITSDGAKSLAQAKAASGSVAILPFPVGKQSFWKRLVGDRGRKNV